VTKAEEAAPTPVEGELVAAIPNADAPAPAAEALPPVATQEQAPQESSNTEE